MTHPSHHLTHRRRGLAESLVLAVSLLVILGPFALVALGG